MALMPGCKPMTTSSQRTADIRSIGNAGRVSAAAWVAVDICSVQRYTAPRCPDTKHSMSDSLLAAAVRAAHFDDPRHRQRSLRRRTHGRRDPATRTTLPRPDVHASGASPRPAPVGTVLVLCGSVRCEGGIREGARNRDHRAGTLDGHRDSCLSIGSTNRDSFGRSAHTIAAACGPFERHGGPRLDLARCSTCYCACYSRSTLSTRWALGPDSLRPQVTAAARAIALISVATFRRRRRAIRRHSMPQWFPSTRCQEGVLW